MKKIINVILETLLLPFRTHNKTRAHKLTGVLLTAAVQILKAQDTFSISKTSLQVKESQSEESRQDIHQLD